MKRASILVLGLIAGLLLGTAHAGEEAPPPGCRCPPPHGPGGPPGFGPRGPGFPMFVQADDNKDGKITRAEIDKSTKQRFDAADSNGSNTLSEKEFASALPMPPPGAPKPPPNMPPPRMLDPGSMFRRTDWNADGAISLEEFSTPIRAMAAHADVNGDGIISEDDRIARPGVPPLAPPPR